MAHWSGGYLPDGREGTAPFLSWHHQLPVRYFPLIWPWSFSIETGFSKLGSLYLANLSSMLSPAVFLETFFIVWWSYGKIQLPQPNLPLPQHRTCCPSLNTPHTSLPGSHMLCPLWGTLQTPGHHPSRPADFISNILIAHTHLLQQQCWSKESCYHLLMH